MLMSRIELFDEHARESINVRVPRAVEVWTNAARLSRDERPRQNVCLIGVPLLGAAMDPYCQI
jgi:hypothetical protein